MSNQKVVKFVLNYGGVRQLLHSSEMSNVLMSHARGMADKAGEGYQAKHMPTRVIVVPETTEAENDNYENNTLLKSRWR